MASHRVNIAILLSCGVIISLISGCYDTTSGTVVMTTSEVRAETIDEKAQAQELLLKFDSHPKRVHLLSIGSKGYPPLEKKRTSWDVGVQQVRNGDGSLGCAFMEPMTDSKAADDDWSPLHIYMNALNKTEREVYSDQIGDREVFFEGDTGGRNGGDDSFKWTLLLPADFRDSLQLKLTKNLADLKEYDVSFIRGPLKYRGAFRVLAIADGNFCTAAAYLCTSLLADGSCAEDGFTKRIHKIIATADFQGGLSDKFYGRTKGTERTDISELVADVSFKDDSGKMIQVSEPLATR